MIKPLLAALTLSMSPLLAHAETPDAAAAIVSLNTTLGSIELTLNPAQAPASVENFLQYVESNHYDGVIFHRVIPGFMIQGGGFTPEMQQLETGTPVQNESDNGLSNRRGTIAMARTRDPDSATAQFFINTSDNRRLDGMPGRPGYTVFGEVTEGMDVVDAINRVQTTRKGRHRDVPVDPVIIESARVITPAPAAE
ncbi:peptidylprolyl isomerase [Marinobacterium weihaiense]|uniref:peptidylprolyl isomerase n=1 Tax=Marinobacterium weihaiense TaxID=2851016 RepID=A0ABS6M702_9GAMM|nr:peptidyl-prolyl cis-trans isomerase [Marinobacterium weihaiense]